MVFRFSVVALAPRRSRSIDDRPMSDQPNPPNARGLTDVLALIEGVDGWMTDGQAAVLFEQARRCRTGDTIVEIGSYRGRSTIVLAAGAPAGVCVVAIDPHAGNDRGPQEFEGFGDAADVDYDVFRANLLRCGVTDRVRHVRAASHAAHSAVDGDIDLLYIDGAHRIAPARRDVREWSQRVAPHGVLMIHDAFSSIGVTAAILSELAFAQDFRYLGRSRSLAIFARRPVQNGRERLVHTVKVMAQLPWFVRNVALKGFLTAGGRRLLVRSGRPVPDWPY
jgi:predicted O-methyltransferase YrrM